MPLRLLHTADWQIGRLPPQFEPDDAAALFEARFAVVERLATLAREQQVDAVLVAGDVFDAQTLSDKSLRRLFLALEGFAGPWCLLPGNHDAALTESVWSRAQRLSVIAPNVLLCLAPRVQVVADRFALLPAPLTQRHTHDDLTQWFDQAETPAGLPRIGLAHGSVQGVLSEDIDAHNPIAPGRAARARLDYLALGDWHGTRAIDARCWYAGTPETDRFRANESGQALKVTLAPGALPQVEPLRTGRYRWSANEWRLSVPSDREALLNTLAQAQADDVLQIKLGGVTDLAGLQLVERGVQAARARVRALSYDASELRLEPTADDIDALQADGYVGAVLEQLRREQSSPAEADAASVARARDALLILARMLDERPAAPATADASAVPGAAA